MKAGKIFIEIDFGAMRKMPCTLCQRPFEEHFQPPPDADKNLAAHWCPAKYREGYTSMVYTRQRLKVDREG